ncbi:MAG: CIA30 family protein [Verrucomicrobiae bacterium]|nr:CIA30 family protein [Verrucomicrobiae bacterium]
MKIKKHIWVSFAALLTVISNITATAKENMITNFSEDGTDGLKWRITDDRVMGGRSQGKFEITNQGTMRFSGNLSLENNGGFSSVRSGGVSFDLSDSEGLALRVKGDGRKYQVRLGTEARYRSWDVSFSAGFQTKKDTWVNVRIPFSDFKAGFRGRSLDQVSFDPSKIRRLGILLGDKKPGRFEVEIDSISAYSGGSSNTIMDLVAADARFKTLAAAVNAAGLGEVLSGAGPFTVFAPTDAAFESLPEGTVEALLTEEGKTSLISILKNHVVSGRADLSSALGAGSISNLENNTLKVTFSEGSVRVNDAVLRQADVSTSNGIVHIIDSVLVPTKEGPTSILETANKAGSFKTLLAAVETAGLEDYLESGESVTIFAPTDAAFNKLPAGTVEQLLKPENRKKLETVLINHALQGSVGAGTALSQGTAETLGNQTLTFKIQEGRFQVNGITIDTVDLVCSNGIIHVVDEVILFEENEDRAGLKINDQSVTPQASIIAAIQQGVPLYNQGNARACADVYRDCIKSLAMRTDLNDVIKTSLNRSLKMSESKSADESAWIYRYALDKTYSTLTGHTL